MKDLEDILHIIILAFSSFMVLYNLGYLLTVWQGKGRIFLELPPSIKLLLVFSLMVSLSVLMIMIVW